jgi:hypothetical protein
MDRRSAASKAVHLAQQQLIGMPASGQPRRFAHAAGISALAATPDVLRRRSVPTLWAISVSGLLSIHRLEAGCLDNLSPAPGFRRDQLRKFSR